MNRQIGYCLEGADVYVLSSPSLRIRGQGFHESGEIAEPMDTDARQHIRAKCGEVHPLVAGVLRGPIIQIESIHVDVGSDRLTLKSKAALRRLAPSLRRSRGYIKTIYASLAKMARLLTDNGRRPRLQIEATASAPVRRRCRLRSQLSRESPARFRGCSSAAGSSSPCPTGTA